jgi:hypothetical protein
MGNHKRNPDCFVEACGCSEEYLLMPALLKFEKSVSVRILKAAYEGVVFLE